MKIYVPDLKGTPINSVLRQQSGACELTGCLGERFIGAGMSDKEILNSLGDMLH